MTNAPDRTESIFAAAVALPVEERAAYLDRECAADVALRGCVEALLRAHERAGHLLDKPVPDSELKTWAYVPNEVPGAVIAGRYKLLEAIGEGGMGTVWVAEQTQPVRRKVALKLIKAGMDSKCVLARFEAERQALALMDHPNVAKVLDGGLTEAGRPFFVMEYVKGVPITEYCDAARLSVPERLKLFAQVCQAVQHAHQKGIIHRDLKPSNILVAPYDDVPVPKIIDFGLAKAMHQSLTERTLHTAHDSVLGTPLYMSPEQAQLNNLDVDTRSDIYSLGVLLYELLTGTTPLEKTRFKEAAWDEIRRIIREEEPQRPSRRLSSTNTLPSLAACRQTEPMKLTTQVRGELDWIVMKALEKDRNRRYETANGFAADVQRYLNDEPVLACPPSAGYRLRKFARRNKSVLATAALVSAAMVVAVIALAISNVWVMRERNEKSQALVDKEAALSKESAALALAKTKTKEAEQESSRAREQALLARRRFYASQMNLAQQAWEAGDPARVVELLESQRPKADEEDLRTFEWRHLWRQSQQAHRLTLRGHSGPVESVAFLPDGKTLASLGGWKIKLWDLSTGQELTTLTGAGCMAVSPDGTKLVAGGQLTTIWDPLTQTKLSELDTTDANVRSLAISPDGNILATGGHSGALMLWDIAARKKLATLPPHKDAVLAVAFSADGKTLATATGWGDSVTKLWDLSADPPRLTRQLTRAKNGLAFLPDGKTLLIAGWGSAVFCDLSTGEGEHAKLGSNFTSISAAPSPDGKSVAFGMEERTVKLWDRAAGHLRTYGHLADIRSVAFSPDGKAVAAGDGDGLVHVWDAFPRPESPPPAAMGFNCAAFSPDGETLALGTSGGTIKLWDMVLGREAATLLGHQGIVQSLAFSPDSQTLASSARDLKLWDLATGRELAILKGVSQPIWSIAFSRDGKSLASGSLDGTAELWDVPTRQVRSTVQGNPVAALAITAAGDKFATAGQYGQITVWDTETGKQQATWVHAGYFLFSVAFSPDGKLLASGGSAGTGTINLWEAATGRLQASLKGHSSAVYSLAFFPDGRTLASASVDGSARLWDVATGQERVSLKIDITGDNYERPFVAISPDGNTLVTGSQGANVKFYRTMAESPAKVQAAWQRAFDRSGDDPLVWIERARWHDDRDERQKADADWQQAVKRFFDDPLVWIHRGRWYAECGEHEKAAADIAKAFELDPFHPLCRLHRAKQNGTPLVTWDFSEAPDTWRAAAHCRMTAAKGVLTIDSTGPDPQLVASLSAPAGKKQLILCARVSEEMDFQLFWATKTAGYSEDKSVRLPITGIVGQFQEYRVTFEPDSDIVSLRLDPPNKAGVHLELAWILLVENRADAL